MFRIESYITSIILSYVDRYVKNFKREDAQLSLWEGDGSLHNLDLDLEVLEQELNLPFSFVSGHIHECYIHVPWTRITSEPVKITINTIECVMKLKPINQSSTKITKKQPPGTGTDDNVNASYMSSLVNTIVCNLSITCNNLILKYVEEDIVLSMNIKTLSWNTVNANWKREFCELTTTQLILRKLINLTDVTICLDKRNASGRIESYLEPLLYKCSLIVRLSQTFPAINSKASSTRIGIHCQNVSLSISEPQVSMTLRLILQARMAMNQSRSYSAPSLNVLNLNEETEFESVDGESWSTWLWGWVPSLANQEATDLQSVATAHTLNFGFYVDNFTFEFKLLKMEDGKTWDSLLHVLLGGCFIEMCSNGMDWMNMQIGISSAKIIPVPNPDDEVFLSCGEILNTFLSGSVFENPDVDLPQRPWDQHLMTITETLLLERSSTFAMDYLSVFESKNNKYTDDDDDDDEDDDGEDNFISNTREKVLVRYVIGPVSINIHTHMMESLEMMMESIRKHDYSIYFQNITLNLSQEEINKQEKHNWQNIFVHHVTQFTMFGAKFRIYPWSNHSLLTKNNNENKKLSKLNNLCHVLIKFKCLDGKITKPLYPEKLIALASKIQNKFELKTASLTSISFMLVGLSSTVIVKDTEGQDIIEMSSISSEFILDDLLSRKPKDKFIQSITHIESILFKCSKPKLTLGIQIVSSILSKEENITINNTSLIHDSLLIHDIFYLLINFGELKLHYIQTDEVQNFYLNICSVIGKVVHIKEKLGMTEYNILVSNSTPNIGILKVLVQNILTDIKDYPPIIWIHFGQIRLNFDQSLYLWLMYNPQTSKSLYRWDSSSLHRKISSSSVGSANKKAVDSKESPTEVVATGKQSAFIDIESLIIKYLTIISTIAIQGNIQEIQISFPSSSQMRQKSILIINIPSIQIKSAQGNFNVKPENLPCQISSWSKNKINFPWELNVMEIHCYSVHSSNYNRLNMVKPIKITCTANLTTKFNSDKDLSAFEFALHIDIPTNVSIAISNQQVALLADIFACMRQVTSKAVVRSQMQSIDELPPGSIQFGPTIESASEHESSSVGRTHVINKAADTSSESKSFKMSCYLQITMAKFILTLYTYLSKNCPEMIKLVTEIDDIFMTLDIEKIYQKLKLRIATANINHYIRESICSPWKMGNFCGVIMKSNESESELSENGGFMAMTLTRANASDLHSRIHSSSISKKLQTSERRYIIEILTQIHPLDFILSPTVIGKFLNVLEPLINKPYQQPFGQGSNLSNYSGQSTVLNYSTSDLPLLYFDSSSFRVFIPATYFAQASTKHDTILFHITKVSLKSEAINPLTRKLLRADLYTTAQKGRLTNLPGSYLEDRQYELNFSVSVDSGKWSQFGYTFCLDYKNDGNQNPAVYWNSGRNDSTNDTLAVFSPFCVSFVIAPPIITAGFIVSGLNIELNLMSEVDISLSLDQLKLICHLFNEIFHIVPTEREKFLYSDNNGIINESSSMDSGVESCDGSAATKKEISENLLKFTAKKSSCTSQVSISTPTSINTKRYQHRSQTVPIDLLLTAKEFKIKLYAKSNDRFEPLVFFLIAQPYVALEKHGDVCIYKASLFKLTICHGTKDFYIDGKMTDISFSECIILTEQGDLDPYKGIPPSLINMKICWQGTRLPTVEIEMGRPMKIKCNVNNIDYLLYIKDLIMSNINFKLPNQKDCLKKQKSISSDKSKEDVIKEIIREEAHNSNALSQYFNSLSLLLLSTKQIVFDFESGSKKKKSIYVGIGSITTSVQFPSNQLIGNITLNNFTLSVNLNATSMRPKLVVNPWTVTTVIHLKDRWPPNLINKSLETTCFVESDVLSIELSKSVVDCIRDIQQEFQQYFYSLLINSETSAINIGESAHIFDDEENHYKDDLQAGAFQIITSRSEQFPNPYQVVFPNKYSMAWCYPAPRAITSLTVLPVPFKEPCPNGLQCILQYLETSPTEPKWKDWLSLKIYETKKTFVELPIGRAQVATSWRIIILPDGNVETIDALALAACIRVDSIFSTNLIPFLRGTLKIGSFRCTFLTNSFPASDTTRLLGGYRLINSVKTRIPICSVIVDNFKLRASLWKEGQFDLKNFGRVSVSTINSRTLMGIPVIRSFPLSCFISKDNGNDKTCQNSLLQINMESLESINCCLAPPSFHVSHAALTRALYMSFIICNDLCYTIRVGQLETDEDIWIPSLCCQSYAWNTTKKKMLLRFSINIEGPATWSVGISIKKNGIQGIELLQENGRQVKVLISIKHLSSTVTQILICGQLIIVNQLDRMLDVRLISSNVAERQRCLLIEAERRGASVALANEKPNYNLRLAFEGHWSGLIPLRQNDSNNKWLVKIPINDKKDFISAWCHIFWESETEIPRIMVLISPLYMIRSLLPCDASVLISSPAFGSSTTQRISGHGALSNLHTPGTTQHEHSLTFHIEGNLPASSPHVPLLYNMLDGKAPPPSGKSIDFQKLLDKTTLQMQYSTIFSKKSYLGQLVRPEFKNVCWLPSLQPDTVTHVKVKFAGDSLNISNSLVVELYPWALLVNTLGLTIFLYSNNSLLCSVKHLSILAPPLLEGTFNISIDVGDTFFKSPELQLSQTQLLYMPHISGLIPQTGSIQTNIRTPESIIFSTIHSKISKGIRIIHMTSTYTISNVSSHDLNVAAVIIQRDKKIVVPNNIDEISIPLPKSVKKTDGYPLPVWHKLNNYGQDEYLYLLFECKGKISSPVLIATNLERDARNFVIPLEENNNNDNSLINMSLVAVLQKKELNYYITVDDQYYPPIIIYNQTNQNLIVAKSGSEQGGSAESDYIDWTWNLIVPSFKSAYYSTVAIDLTKSLPNLVLARPEFCNNWSTSISLISCKNGRLVNVPQCPDITATVNRRSFITHIILRPASHSIISASDIRTRLALQRSIPDSDDIFPSQDNNNLLDAKVNTPKQNNAKKETLHIKHNNNITVNCYFRGLTFTVCEEIPETFEWQQVAALSFEDVGITFTTNNSDNEKHGEMDLRLTFTEVEIDNLEFEKRCYDFGVILTKQRLTTDESLKESKQFNTIQSRIDDIRQNKPALDFHIIFDTSKNFVIEDIEIDVAPLQAYVEDTFFKNLKLILENLIPVPLSLSETFMANNYLSLDDSMINSNDDDMHVKDDLLTELQDKFKPKDTVEEISELDDLFNVSEPEIEANALAVAEKRISNNQNANDDDLIEIVNSELELDDDCVISESIDINSIILPLSPDIITSSMELSRPLRLRSFNISEINILITVHTSTTFYLALDKSPLHFSKFERSNVVTTTYRLGHALTLHYFLGAIYGTGWALGSLGMFGAPAGLARSVGSGLKSFVELPARGAASGPTGFILGALHGSASLMAHITAGTLESVVKFAGSWSRTLDRLTLIGEDLKYAEEMRRIRPQGLGQAIKMGLTEFGISILGGVGGLAQRPLEYAMGSRDGSTFVGSLGRGLVGAMARPLSGAAELVALTGKGILAGVGWDNSLTSIKKQNEYCDKCSFTSKIKYSIKLLQQNETVLCVSEATSMNFTAVTVVITTVAVYIINEFDELIRSIKHEELTSSKHDMDPSLLKLIIQTPDAIAEKLNIKRITEFVRGLQDQAYTSVNNSPTSESSATSGMELYFHPAERNYVFSILEVAKRINSGKGFILVA